MKAQQEATVHCKSGCPCSASPLHLPFPLWLLIERHHINVLLLWGTSELDSIHTILELDRCIHPMYNVYTNIHRHRHEDMYGIHPMHTLYIKRHKGRHEEVYCTNTYSHNTPYSPSRSLWLTIFQTPVDIICRFMRPCCQVPVFAWNKKWDASQQQQHSNNSVYSGQRSICQPRPWQHTSALRWQHQPCGAAEFPVWKLIRPSLHVVLCDRTPATLRLDQLFHLSLGKR